MPQRNSSRRLVLRLVLFTLAGWLLWALGRDDAKPAGGGTEGEPVQSPGARVQERRARFSRRRLATTLAFTTLFFAGAAFSAGAGDQLACELQGLTEPDAACETAAADSSEAATTEASEEATEPAPAADEAPDSAPSEDQSGSGEAAGDPAEGQAGGGGSAGGNEAEQGDGQGSGHQAGGGAGDAGEPVLEPSPVGGDGSAGGTSAGDSSDDGQSQEAGTPGHLGDAQPSSSGGDAGPMYAEQASPDLEFDSESGFGVVWLHRTLPDPTPPASRLSPTFARRLVATSRENRVEWQFVLGVLRAQGHRGRNPADVGELRTLASRLHGLHANTDEWRAALALNGRTAFADRATALTRYNRAVGLRSLVRGLQSQERALERKVLADSRIDVYAGGRADIADHRINVRVLVLLLYLAESHGQVTVSCLESGHRLYARPGVISAHIYGLAADISGLEGQSILGHQQVGGLTERAVRNILLLPSELQPKQVISLLGLGGPSFPLANHYDHIHVGY
jgi:hypothetical protein